MVENWHEHLSSTGVPRIHFVDSVNCDSAALSRATGDLGFVEFRIDGRGVQSKDDLLEQLAERVRFPSGFGRNWDAVSDYLRDLSWAPAKGYVLLVTDSDNLLRLDHRDLAAFMGVVEAAIQDWRDERGEYGERTAPTAFHLVLCGTKAMKAEVSKVLTEAFCEHYS